MVASHFRSFKHVGAKTESSTNDGCRAHPRESCKLQSLEDFDAGHAGPRLPLCIVSFHTSELGSIGEVPETILDARHVPGCHNIDVT